MAIERGGLMRGGLRVTLVAVAVIGTVLAGVFLAGIEVSGEFLRPTIERALTAAFRVPARIAGPIKLRTGLSATVSADALVLDDPSGPAGATLARGIHPSARIDLVALLRRVIALDEVTGERLELMLARRGDGSANWAPLFAASREGGESTFSFGGIAHLRIGSVMGSYLREGAAPAQFAIAALDAALPLRETTAVHGSALLSGQQVDFDLRSASLADLVAPGGAIPVQGSVDWSGVRAEVDGALARDGSRFDADVRGSADDASVPIAALGLASNEPGRLELRMRLGVTATEASAQDLALTMGQSVASGSASIAWAESRWQVAADIAGERIDLEPLLLFEKKLLQDGTLPAVLFELLELAATGANVEVKLAAGELVGLPVTAHDFRFEGRSRDQMISGSGDAIISGTRVEARLDYDARRAQRSLAASLQGGAASTAALPGKARPSDVSGSVAGIRGQLRAQGENSRELVASVEANLEAHDLRWTVDLRRGPLDGRFDLVRVAVQGTRTSSAEVAGKLGDAACSLKASGGALAPLLEGEPWPLQITGSCPGERFSAKGRLSFAQRRVVGELTFDAAAGRLGPVAKALGAAQGLPYPIAVRGSLALDERLALARLAALRLGRTAGSGEVAYPLGNGAPARVKLALTLLDLDEFSALANADRVPAGHSERGVHEQDTHLADIDFEIAADRVTIADEKLRRLKFAGGIRSRKLPTAPFQFEWEGAPVSGNFGADFSGAAKRIELDAAAKDVDLRALLARFGQADIALRAGTLSLKARAEGAKVGDLLASATLSGAIERGQLDLARRPAPRLFGRSEFSATLTAAPGRSTTLSARGTVDGEPMELGVEASGLAELAPADTAIPVTVRLTLGDTRLDATGQIARDGSGTGRLQLSGARLDRLGRLIGVALPEEGPYSASADVVATADAIRADDFALNIARSRVAGQVRIEQRRGGRPLYVARLRAPTLHLEDIGADQWLGSGWLGPSTTEAAGAPAASRAKDGGERGLDFLRAADVDVTIDVEALYGAGQRFASGRAGATINGGVMRVQLQDVQTAGGGVDADIRIDATAAQPKFSVRARIRDLEYGPLARSMDPRSTAGGRLDLVVDLAAEGLPPNLLPSLAGTVDAAVFPRDLQSRALNLWGTGLLTALLQQLDPASQSVVECGVTSLDVKGGVASSTAFFVDATRVRIIGEFEVDLATRELSGRVDPQSKYPEILTFAPTMLLGGTVDSPRVTSAPANVVAVPLRFATSVASFARDWVGARGKAREGAPGCKDAFEQIRQARSGAQ